VGYQRLLLFERRRRRDSRQESGERGEGVHEGDGGVTVKGGQASEREKNRLKAQRNYAKMARLAEGKGRREMISPTLYIDQRSDLFMKMALCLQNADNG
jgi:hypothetical protein